LRLPRLSLRGKLLASSLLLIGLTAIGSLLALDHLRSVERSGIALHETAYKPTTAALEVQVHVKNLTINNLNFQLLVGKLGAIKAKQTPAFTAINDSTAAEVKALATLVPTLRTAPPALRPQAEAIAQGITNYNTALAAAHAATKPADIARTVKALAAVPPAIQASTSKFTAASDRQAQAAENSIRSSYKNGRTTVIVALLLTLLAGLAVSLRVSALVRRGVKDILTALTSLRDHDTAALRKGLDAVAHGDLTHPAESQTQSIAPRSQDEIGEIATMVEQIRVDTATSVASYNASLDGLGSMIGRVSVSATTLSAASEQMAVTSRESGRAVHEIASAVEDVATGAERQVQSIDGARRLTTDMVRATQSSSRTAGETAKAADAARDLAVEGAEAVRQATDAMAAVRDASTQATGAIRGLGAKSEQIGGIVDAITAIAGQTNLLALNAAIEAARAGEQGRGFAVVAEEVRKLAEESQTAAASIAALIKEIQAETARAVEVVELGAARTDQGTQTVASARAVFERITDQVAEMSTRVGEIAESVELLSTTSSRMDAEIGEVAAISEETSAATEEVSASTQETSAATQQIAASADTLVHTAVELSRLVGEFKLPA
jgi:methyl-accepting chemotaxis protein